MTLSISCNIHTFSGRIVQIGGVVVVARSGWSDLGIVAVPLLVSSLIVIRTLRFWHHHPYGVLSFVSFLYSLRTSLWRDTATMAYETLIRMKYLCLRSTLQTKASTMCCPPLGIAVNQP